MDEWIFRFLILFFSGAFLPLQETFGIGDTHLCSQPLGMESKEIPDSALSVSSYYVLSVGPHQARLNNRGNGGAWCPKGPIEIGVREWLQVSLNRTHLLSAVQIQGRLGNGNGQEYAEEFEIEYWRAGFSDWRKYYKFDGKTVLAGNSDTTSVVTNKLRPPLLAQKIRVLPYSTHRRTVCLRLELLGCPWEDGVVSYRMIQGDTFTEGISLRDESYDGNGSKWDRKVDPTQRTVELLPNEKENIFTIFHEDKAENDESSSDLIQRTSSKSSGGEEKTYNNIGTSSNGDFLATSTTGELNPILTGGLGQLTDKIEGANSFTMDIGYGLGNGWVGWKRRKIDGERDDFIEIVVEFDEVRYFHSVDLFTNNYPSKGVQIFSMVKVYFSIGGIYFNGKGVRHVPVTDVTLEHARNLTLSLEGRIARYLKLHLYFRSPWIVLGELYFHSEIYDGNFTVEEGPEDAPLDTFLDTQSSLEIRDLDSSMMETVVGIISGLILLLGVVAGLIIWMRRSGRSFPATLHFHPSSAFPFWRSSPWTSVPTHIVAQNNPTTEGVKDLLLTLTPLSNGIGNGGTVGDIHYHHQNSVSETSNLMVNNGNGPHDFKAYNPPTYTNGTLSTTTIIGKKSYNHTNGLPLQGSHHNHYGTTKKSGENENFKRTPSLTLRSNQLATLDEPPDYDEDGGGEEDSCNNIYQEALNTIAPPTTTTGPSTNLRTNKNRKIRVSGSAWNLNSDGKFYRNHPGRLVPEVSLRQLRLIENLGSCFYGQVHLYEFEGEIACHEGTLYRNCRLIAKTIKSVSEIRLLSILDHEHVLEMIGVCNEMKNPRLALFPAPECGDLCSFLSRLTTTPSLSWLLSVGSQIASGMNYLESLSLIHRDLAARNCLVESEGSIRIADLAMACEQYHGDYCHTSRGLAPLRWWSWESILSDEFTMKSSVWSYGVTLWEILTLCRQKPLAHIPDHQILTLAQKYGSTATSQQVWLPQPVLSPPEIFDLMRECWQKVPGDRPTFQHIHLFLEQKCNNSANAIYHVV